MIDLHLKPKTLILGRACVLAAQRKVSSNVSHCTAMAFA